MMPIAVTVPPVALFGMSAASILGVSIPAGPALLHVGALHKTLLHIESAVRCRPLALRHVGKPPLAGCAVAATSLLIQLPDLLHLPGTLCRAFDPVGEALVRRLAVTANKSAEWHANVREAKPLLFEAVWAHAILWEPTQAVEFLFSGWVAQRHWSSERGRGVTPRRPAFDEASTNP